MQISVDAKPFFRHVPTMRDRKKLQPPATPPAPAEPHLIGYARVSMADQDPRLQIDALLRAGVDERDIYVEKASSTAKRRQFEAALKDCREGDILVVWKLDRLGRTARQVLETFHDLTARGVAVRVLTQPGMDTSTSMGRLIITVMAAVAEMERDLIRERTMAGLAAARDRGIKGGARPKVPDDKIRTARIRIDKGADAKQIATELGMTRSGLYKAFTRLGLDRGER